MASTITNYSNDINIKFPVPGVDNDSQGFRTNFAKIQSALSVASDEITSLQLASSDPSDVILNSYTASELYNLGAVDDGTMVFLTDTTNKPAYYLGNNWYVFTGTSVTLSGTTAVEDANNITVNGQLLLNGSQALTNAGAADLSVTASYFTTTSSWTATLAAGTAGLIKTFMSVSTGTMVITVTNAGWKSSGSGTVTFNAIGKGCTLQYINSKWFCIGNNGATFG